MDAKKIRKRAGKKDADSRIVNLALQGGGAHGAFTWGVLDRLLEEVEAGRLKIDGLSGTSAGALNAVVMKYGMLTGGPEKARELLDQLWEGVSKSNVMSPLHEFNTRVTGDPNLDHNPWFAGLNFWQGLLSPQQTNPMDINPLRDLVNDIVDFDELAARMAEEDHDTLYIGATNVSKGDPKVFRGGEITSDAVMASACLPDVFHPVEINGEFYWDGGYMGNPPMEDLAFKLGTDDTVIVQINGFQNDEAPRSRADINNVENHLKFNSALVHELRGIERMNKMLESGMIKPSEQLRMQRLHRIRADGAMDLLNHSSKGNTAPSFLRGLKELGRATAEQWLAEAAPKIGKESTWGFDWSDEITVEATSTPKPEASAKATKKPADRRTRLRGKADEILGRDGGAAPQPRVEKPAPQPPRRAVGGPAP